VSAGSGFEAVAVGGGTGAVLGGLRALLGGEAARFGMCPPVVLGQRLAESAGPVGHCPLADLAAGDRELGNGDRETA
jgi:hypothetical protein